MDSAGLNEKLWLNAHIERLIESKGNDEEARRAIAAFAAKIPSSTVQIEGLFSRPGGNIAGQTPEHGLVGIKDENQNTVEFSRGAVQERAGLYKISRHKKGNGFWIGIAHFWKHDMGTESDAEPAQEWVLATERTGTPVWFGERGFRNLFTIPLSRRSGIEVRRELFEESWGKSIGALHKGGILLRVVLAGPD